MKVAVAYYPEQWPEERWEIDAGLMEKAGVQRVRLGEFAWALLEPEDRVYDFDWLESAIELFARHGIETMLCTPTATYPAWLHRKYPDLHQVKSSGQIKEWGQRQDACKNHPGYRAAALRITERLALLLGDHPNVTAWQTDNELGNHGTARCYCSRCEKEFRGWLRNRFDGDIEAINRAWGTAVWSQSFRDFAEIALPRDTADRPAGRGNNPGLLLDFYRFSSDVQVRFQRELIGILRSRSPGRIITHNLMGGFSDVDYYALARDLDIVSWDNYPFSELPGIYAPPQRFEHELMRGLKRRNVWIMEQAAGTGGWDIVPPNVEPCRMRLWAYQAVARGADMICFFRWRTGRFGVEQFWHGILDHHGSPRRRYEELVSFGREIRKLDGELDGTTVSAECAVLFDYATLWSFEIQPQAAKDFDYRTFAARIVDVLTGSGISVDVVGPECELSRYRLVIAPSLHICSGEIADRLRRYVHDGGVLVVGPRSGVRDEENGVVDEILPGRLRELAGCEVEEYDFFSGIADCSLELLDNDGNRYRALGVAELLVTDEDAGALLSYHGRYYTGRTAAVEKSNGKGRTIYLGTVLDEEGIGGFIGPVVEACGLRRGEASRLGGTRSCSGFPDGIETALRTRKNAEGEIRYRFYLNHSNEKRSIIAGGGGIELLSEASIESGGELDLEPFGVAIVKEKEVVS